MTKREKHEIAVVTKCFIEDECDEIRVWYKKVYGDLKGLRKYIRNELIDFWSYTDPYLDVEYLDYCWMKIGNRIINLDDSWCYIRNNLEFEFKSKNI